MLLFIHWSKFVHDKPIKLGDDCLLIQNEQTTQVLPCVQVPGNYGEIISMLIDQSEGLDQYIGSNNIPPTIAENTQKGSGLGITPPKKPKEWINGMWGHKSTTME